MRSNKYKFTALSFESLEGKLNSLQTEKYLSKIRVIDSRKHFRGSVVNWGVEHSKRVAPLYDNSRYDKRTTSEVVKFYETLDRFKNEPTRQLTNDVIKRIEESLTGCSDYRKEDYFIWIKNPLTEKTIDVDTCPSADIVHNMNVLLEWFNSKDATVSPIMLASIVSYEILKIHPFKDGNGRLSRVLINLILLNRGYSFVKYSSLESYFDRHRKLQTVCIISSVMDWTVFLSNALLSMSDNLLTA